MYKNACAYLIILIFVVYTYLPSRHAKWYNYVKADNVLSELELLKADVATTNLKMCPYEDLIKYGGYIKISDVYMFQNFEDPFTDVSEECTQADRIITLHRQEIPPPRRLNKLRNRTSPIYPANCREGSPSDHVTSSRRFLDAKEVKDYAGHIESTPRKRSSSAKPRNPLNGVGVDAEEDKKCSTRRKDGNPLLGEGYESKSVTPITTRIPRGGYSQGGEYFPSHCSPLIKTALIIPYRNRTEQLKIFLNYMHNFLQKQNIHYRIFVVEQKNNDPFNRAKLLNIGAKEAIKLNFTCLVLHDVDLLPLHSGNLYACARKPRHMCSSLDTLRYNLPYEELFGGVISIKAVQFEIINGMSNEYIGWGGEDDDLYRRLRAANLMPYRFAPSLSRYTMLKHRKAPPSDDRFNKLERFLDREYSDGLNSLTENYVFELKKLHTHILVP